jgi:hypothetical protein
MKIGHDENTCPKKKNPCMVLVIYRLRVGFAANHKDNILGEFVPRI